MFRMMLQDDHGNGLDVPQTFTVPDLDGLAFVVKLLESIKATAERLTVKQGEPDDFPEPPEDWQCGACGQIHSPGKCPDDDKIPF